MLNSWHTSPSIGQSLAWRWSRHARLCNAALPHVQYMLPALNYFDNINNYYSCKLPVLVCLLSLTCAAYSLCWSTDFGLASVLLLVSRTQHFYSLFSTGQYYGSTFYVTDNMGQLICLYYQHTCTYLTILLMLLMHLNLNMCIIRNAYMCLKSISNISNVMCSWYFCDLWFILLIH